MTQDTLKKYTHTYKTFIHILKESFMKKHYPQYTESTLILLFFFLNLGKKVGLDLLN